MIRVDTRPLLALLTVALAVALTACSDVTSQASQSADAQTATPSVGSAETTSPAEPADMSTEPADARSTKPTDDGATGPPGAGGASEQSSDDAEGDDPADDSGDAAGDDSGDAPSGNDDSGDDDSGDGATGEDDSGDAPDGDGDGDGVSGTPDRGITSRLERGGSGAQVTRLQRRLEQLHYWVGPKDGVFGQLTEQAVFAFQGVEGLAIDGIVGPDTRAALADASPPEPRTDEGDLIEVDEQARVVMDVRDGEVRWVWHTSTGTNERYQHPAGHTALAETPDGTHTIDWQVDGWRRNELGRLWRPKYFHPDGIAIHGFSSVPATPSSHGCVRVTKAAMNFIWNNDIAPEGSTVVVYGRAP